MPFQVAHLSFYKVQCIGCTYPLVRISKVCLNACYKLCVVPRCDESRLSSLSDNIGSYSFKMATI